MVEKNRFKLKYIHMIPSKIRENIFSFIYINKRVMVVNEINEEIFYLSDENFNDCKQVQLNDYICKLMNTINNNNFKDCLTELIETNKINKNLCNIKMVKINHELFFKLRKDNSWFYSVLNKTIVKFICNNNNSYIHKVLLNSTGIITIQPKCIMKSKSITIYSQNTIESDYKLDLSTNFKFNISSILDKYEAINLKDHNISVSNQHDLFKLGISLNKLNEDIINHNKEIELKKLIAKSYDSQLTPFPQEHNVYHFSVFYLCLGIVLFCFASCGLWKIYKIYKGIKETTV